MPERMSTARRVAFSLGNAGFQITDRIVVVIAVYFYLPPEGRGLEAQVPSAVFLGFLTAYGAATLLGRVFDSAADPIVGHLSDRSRSRLGRRRAFLIAGVVPMVATPVLLFWPPGEPGSVSNVFWLGGLLAVYFVAFTVYVAPYLALVPELAWTEPDRVRLGRLLAMVGFPLGAAVGTVWTLGYELGRDAGLEPVAAMRVVVVGASVAALFLCLAPVAAVDERRFARSTPATLSFRQALGATLTNRPFRLYLVAQLAFIFGSTLVQPLLPYLVTVVLGRDEGYAAVLGGVLLLGIALGIALVGPLTARLGVKRTWLGAGVLFSASVAALGLLTPDVPGGPHDARNLAIVYGACAVMGLPVAGLLVLPQVLIGQLIDYDAAHTGAQRSAMYFGVQGLLTKWMYGVSLWVMTFLLSRFGNSAEEPLGVLLVGPVAGVACVIALVLFARYPERELLEAARRREAT